MTQKKRKHNPAWDSRMPDPPLGKLVRARLEKLDLGLADLGRCVGAKYPYQHAWLVVDHGRALPEKYWPAWMTLLEIPQGSEEAVEFIDAARKQSLMRERRKGVGPLVKMLEAQVNLWRTRALKAEARLRTLEHASAPQRVEPLEPGHRE